MGAFKKLGLYGGLQMIVWGPTKKTVGVEGAYKHLWGCRWLSKKKFRRRFLLEKKSSLKKTPGGNSWGGGGTLLMEPSAISQAVQQCWSGVTSFRGTRMEESKTTGGRSVVSSCFQEAG